MHVNLYDDGNDILRVVATRTTETVEAQLVPASDDPDAPLELRQVPVEREQTFTAYGWVSALSNHYDADAYGDDGQLRDSAQDEAAHALHEAELAYEQLLATDGLDDSLPRDLEDAQSAHAQLLAAKDDEEGIDALRAEAAGRVEAFEQRIAAAQTARTDAGDATIAAKKSLAAAAGDAKPGIGKPRSMTDDEIRAYALRLLAEQCPALAEAVDPSAAPAPLKSFEV